MISFLMDYFIAPNFDNDRQSIVFNDNISEILEKNK